MFFAQDRSKTGSSRCVTGRNELVGLYVKASMTPDFRGAWLSLVLFPPHIHHYETPQILDFLLLNRNAYISDGPLKVVTYPLLRNSFSVRGRLEKHPENKWIRVSAHGSMGRMWLQRAQ
ncbi:signal recognition particle 9 kDa protein [Platysternon megacephalum]|uniref:Signal recognition particle 9 kDa protein n=1 Tax=Platysternon megacephalum TaxID=55544 RepID=A0A4D9EGF6_9SAUR|nr:signal recognition particle 9 kDa protein [Platysternon megacephalum]